MAPASARFCPRCGAAISAPPPAATPSPPPAATPSPPPAAAPPRRALGCLRLAGLATLCLVLAGGLLLARAIPGTPWGGPDATASPVAVLTPLASETIAPSDTVQGLSWEGQAAVSIPAGLLREPQQVSISSVTGLPTPELPLPSQLLAQYDFSVGELERFEEPLVIELAYDPDRLRGLRPAEESLTALYWDDQLGEWVTLPSFVDAERHTLVALTTHLSVVAAALTTASSCTTTARICASRSPTASSTRASSRPSGAPSTTPASATSRPACGRSAAPARSRPSSGR